MKTLILTPNKTEMCGMYQLAKDLSKELKGDIQFKEKIFGEGMTNDYLKQYDKVITLMYPMHSIGKWMKKNNKTHWICYNQKIPPVTKQYFPNFWRRQAMRYINWRNNITMKGADEYWDVTEREQKPRWTKRTTSVKKGLNEFDYACYLGRQTDYKNYEWLNQTMKKLNIPLLCTNNHSDNDVWELLSNTKLLVTASIWEGFGRSVNEAESLGIAAVAYDVGTHKKHIRKGICVPLDINNMQKSEEKFKDAVLKIWNS